MRSAIKVLVLLVVGFTVGVLAVRYRHNNTVPAPAANEAAPAESSQRAASPPPAAPPPAAESAAVPALPDFSQLASRYSDSVVNVSTTTRGSSGGDDGQGQGGGGDRRFHGSPRGQMPGFPGGPGGPGGNDDGNDFWGPFERFFGPMPRRPQKSLGSGFVFDQSGYILTNNHVVEGGDEITVKLNSGKELKAKLVGRDAKTDVAVIKVDDETDLPAAIPFGDSDALKVGEWVMAIGNPFGLEHTVTAGIVSAKGRFIGQGNYDNFIQTDAAINPGNSGGPLINLRGEAVGINTSIFSRSGGNIGIGFAIPINLAKDLIPDLKEKGRVVRGWIGVMIQKVTPDIAESLGLPGAKGALVADVVKGGPAEGAGIKTGDVIVSFDGHDIKESTELPLLVARTPIGRDVDIKVIRGKEEKTITMKIAEMKDEETQVASKENESFGLTVQNLTPDLADSLGLPNDLKGVVVSGVSPGSTAEDAGLRRGDVILEVNRQVVADVDAYRKQVASLEKGKSLLLLVKRGDNTIFVAVKPPTG